MKRGITFGSDVGQSALIRVGKNHDFCKKIKKSDFFDLNRIFYIFCASK